MQEEFGLYWAGAERVAEGEVAGIQFVVQRRREGSEDPRFGFAACLMGRAGDFAGSFSMFHVEQGVRIRGRWCTTGGRWFKFSRDSSDPQDWPELLAFAKAVATCEGEFPASMGAVPVD